MIRTTMILIAGLTLAGCCGEGKMASQGVVQSVDFKTSSFNASDITVIQTTTKTVMLKGPKTITTGAELFVYADKCDTYFMTREDGKLGQ
jgi:hypothetical protein